MQHEFDRTSAATAAVARLAAGGPAGCAGTLPSRRGPARCRAAAMTVRRRTGHLVLGGTLLALAACGGVQPAHLAETAATGNNGGSEHNLYFDSTGHAHFL